MQVKDGNGRALNGDRLKASVLGYGHDAIVACHDAIGDGKLELCRSYFASGACICCTFWHGNWIGVVPGERAVLDKGDIAGWTDYKEGMQCHRDPARCHNKPLDCKLYPFFPYEVVDNGSHCRVYIGAGDENALPKVS